MRLSKEELQNLLENEGYIPRIIDMTEEIADAKSSAKPCLHYYTEPWEDHIDFKQISLDYDVAKVGDEYYCLEKYGLWDDVTELMRGFCNGRT